MGLDTESNNSTQHSRHKAKISHAVVWVRIPNLPIAQYHPQILRAIGNIVGDTVQIDDASLHAQRGRYARLAVEVDLTAPLRSSVTLDRETLLVTYEGLPPVCYTCGIVGHSPTACSKKSGAAAEDASPSTTSGAGSTEQGESLEPEIASRTDGMSNNYGPWTNVQRRRPRPSVKGRPQTGTSDSRGASVKEGSRFAALNTVDAGLEPGHPSKPPTGQLEGLDQQVPVGDSSGPKDFQFKGALGRQSTQARKSTQASKGKSLVIPPLARKHKGQTSAAPTLDVTNFSPIQLQPTAQDRNLVVVLPTHSEMVCDRQLITVPDQAPGERTSPMVGVKEPGTGVGLPELPSMDPPNVSMTSSGLDDNPGLLKESSFDPAPHAMESGEPCEESGMAAPR
ncbi:hypothetical protein K2173_028486 [Erythroxylum novogranatense]|uniref:CCHC-type domain-containing protein n=1 Tax=Erythroxylum novogranatense TaxID=1862640 RepID=A0AAV8U5C1_9ROSI|nr:hypothetical protein K2173_028486 [Erythroxylum novogranatense]